MKIKTILPIALTIFLLSGCVTKKRCAAKFPVTTETITIIKDTTIVTASKQFDTIVRFHSKDTIFIRGQKTRVEVKILRLPGDSIFVDAKCPSDTIRIPVVRTVTKTEGFKDPFPWRLLFVVLGIFGVLLFFLKIRK